MAGATNRALKAAGIPKATIQTLRVESGGRLSLRSAIGMAHERKLPVGKAVEHMAKRDARQASSKEGQAAAGDFRAKAAAAMKAAGERKAAAESRRAALQAASAGRAALGMRTASQLRSVRAAMSAPGGKWNKDPRLTPRAQAAANIVKSGQTMIFRTGPTEKRVVYEIRKTADGGAEMGMYVKRPGKKPGDKSPVKFLKADDAVHWVSRNVPADAIDRAVKRYATPGAASSPSRFERIRNVPRVMPFEMPVRGAYR
jgi:hypothetical protein